MSPSEILRDCMGLSYTQLYPTIMSLEVKRTLEIAEISILDDQQILRKEKSLVKPAILYGRLALPWMHCYIYFP